MDLVLREKDQRRAEVLRRLCDGSVTRSQAEALLGVGRRQMDRLVASYREKGVESVIHGNRGRRPANKTPVEVARAIVVLLGERGKYHGFNICHAHDLLEEDEEIRIGRSTLDRLLREQGIVESQGRVSPPRRKRRERARREGEMLQIDGSPHDWLEGRGPRMCLMGAVDDATGSIIYGRFRPTEDLRGYLMMLREISRTRGLPESIYHDRHTILRSPKAPTIEEELAGTAPMSQFQRVMEELGIASIPAGSPQAKGRVERLWGVLQDRLVKEMRLEGISSLDDANAFLPGFIRRYNRRFAVKAVDPEAAWVKVESRMDLAYYFCSRDGRVVKSDHTIGWYGRVLQILPGTRDRSLAGCSVNVHVTPEDEVFIYDGKRRLNYRVIPSVERTPLPKAPRIAKSPSPDGQAKRRAWLFAEPAA